MASIDIPNDYPGIMAARLAQKEEGIPYVWGGETVKGFDCSGLAQYVYAHSGIIIPRTTTEQFTVARISIHDQRLPGDLLFFAGSDGTATEPGHVMVLYSAGIAIEAPQTGEKVKQIAYPQSQVLFVTRPSLLAKPYKATWPAKPKL